MKLVDALSGSVRESGGVCVGEDRGDRKVLGPRDAIANQRLPHSTRQESGGIGIAIPIESGNERGVDVPVSESGEGGTRARSVLLQRDSRGGGRAIRGDDGRGTDEEGVREVEGPIVEIPLPSPDHEGLFIMHRVAKKNIVCASLVFK